MFKFQATPTISELSTRYMRCAVSATDSGVPIDPTAGTVEFAFMTGTAQPGDLDWKVGSWETTSSDYFGRCLIGPEGTVALPAGTYTVWIKLVLAPETVVESVGDLNIY